MQESVFTKIINGDLPAHTIYEDELTIAILTIQPVHPGHTLVIPKTQIDQIIDLSEEDYAAVWETVRKIGSHIREVTGKERVGIVVKGIDVPHAHVHLIPFDRGEGLKADEEIPVESDEVLTEMAERLVF
jgi:histidine triad (HIT) family protein